jgi:hypothetical protein
MKTAVEQLIAKYNKQWNKYGMGSVVAYSQVVADLEKLKEMEKEQRQEDTNYGYSQGWDDGNQNQEPMRPELKQQEQ